MRNLELGTVPQRLHRHRSRESELADEPRLTRRRAVARAQQRLDPALPRRFIGPRRRFVEELRHVEPHVAGDEVDRPCGER